ncbi:MAG: GAF domain-containing protein [Anaerolineae bacterium]
MSLILIVSIVIRLVAMGWSIVLLRRVRDWRMGFLTAMLALMALRQGLTLLAQPSFGSLSALTPLTESPGLIVSVLAFLSVIFLERILSERKRQEEESQDRERFLALLNDVTLTALRTPDFREMLQILADRLGDLIDADGCYLTLWDETTQTAIPAAAYGELRETYSAIRLEPGETTATESALKAGHVLVIEDVFNSPYLSPRIVAMFPTHSLLALPLIAGDQKLGAALIGFDEPHHFTPDEIARGEQIANQIALALATARSVEEAKTQTDRLEALYETGKDLTSTLELDGLLQLIVERATRLAGADKGLILLVDTEAEALTKAVGVGFAPGQIEDITYQEIQDGISGWVLREGKPTISQDLLSDPRNRGLALTQARRESEQGQSLAVAPLSIRGTVRGTLTLINNAGKPAFNSGSLDLLVLLASQAAIAIENARLFESTRASAEQLKAASHILRRLNATPDVTQIFPEIAASLQAITGCERSSLALLNEDRNWFTIVALDRPREEVGQGIPLQAADTGAAEDILAGRVHLTPNLTDESHLPIERTLYEAGYRSRVNLPLYVGERVIGALNLIWLEPAGFDPDQLVLLTQIANAIALALERSYLFETVEQHAAGLEAVRQASLNLTAQLELPAVLQAILESTLKLVTAAQNAHIFLYDAGRLAFGAALWADGRQTPVLEEPRTEGLTYTVARRGEPVFVSDMHAHPLYADAPPDWTGAIIGLPLKIGQRVVGVMNVSYPQPRAWPEAELRVLRLLGDQAAIAIENARLHQAARQQGQQVRQILDTVQEGILLLDQDFRIELANPAAQEYLAALAGANIGETVTHLGEHPLAEVLAGHDGDRWLEVTLAGPPQRVFEVAARPLAEEPQAGGWVMVVREMTAERQIQERVQLQARLAAVGQLAAGIAHDFNNILTSIIGFAELSRHQPGLPETVHHDLSRITQQGRRAASLVSQILDFSRQSMAAERRPMDLVPFLKKVVRLLERTIPENIQIELDLARDCQSCTLSADPTQIQQVLTNLAVNARDAMPAGGKLKFRLSCLTFGGDDLPPIPEIPPGDWLVLSVSDTGSGIPPEVLPHIFEPFFTTKEVGQGTGLGLAQVYGLVRQHGGYIEAASRPGQGATFTLYFPALPPSDGLPAPAAQEDVPHGGGEVILLVEDEPNVLNVARAMLQHLGYQVLSASNGREALQIYGRHRDDIALVLTDISMPEMGGLDLARALHEQDPHLKVVAITGYPLRADPSDALAQNVADWVKKPLDINILAEKVRRSLKGDGQS